jgi:hypothetical protein
MGGQGQTPTSFHQAQMQQQFNSMPSQQQPYSQQYTPNPTMYSHPSQPVQSYYTQQTQQQPPQQQQQQPPRPTPTQGSYAARSVAAHTPTPTPTPQPSTHGNNTPAKIDPAYQAEQSRLLQQAMRKLTEASGMMNRAMEENDAMGVLEMACVLLEELGDPNHGVKGQVRM